ncbi:integrase catalytic domain-containing protein [Trichonephila inaurata madagascariensis]|uniref:Integrase catalytic domain-containing protein n=1 Tax=Trichonephila inaurata madagascariensis TaxID=2747483 RepID=A0A8X7CD26_9ARAC|nr:integrase catalytic domain-containing protein [Trichonephila inaurata madagascariensis]
MAKPQIRKIDEDSSIPPEDKFQYRLQAVVPKSKAARVVEIFPATADNYPKAIAQLKDRFGREDLLVQIYVWDLLPMVMKYAVSGRATTDLPSLYGELESKIRALESYIKKYEVLTEQAKKAINILRENGFTDPNDPVSE